MVLGRTLTVVLLGIGSLALVASGAVAEWLVTSDGSRVEIVGPWQVQGKRVTFTLPNGSLGSLPLSEVDLEATELLLREQEETANRVEEPAPRPKAVMVVTDADVGHAHSGGGTGEGESSAEAAARDNPAGLRVAGWRESVDLSSNAVRIVGELQNPTENPATSIDLEVRLYDDEGRLLESSPARLDRGFLNPGATVRFEANFVETLSFDRVDFGIRSRGFLSNPPPDEETESAEEPAPAESGS